MQCRCCPSNTLDAGPLVQARLLLGPKVSKKWDENFPRQQEQRKLPARLKEIFFERLKVISRLWILWIVISHWIFFSCRSTSLCILCTHLCWKMCICFYALCNLHVSYDAFYFIAGVWVGSVAAISMLAARSRQRRWPAILDWQSGHWFFDESIPLAIEHEMRHTLSDTLMVQWNMGVSPILATFWISSRHFLLQSREQRVTVSSLKLQAFLLSCQRLGTFSGTWRHTRDLGDFAWRLYELHPVRDLFQHMDCECSFCI